MAKIYYDADVDMSILSGKRIGVIGYGSQGRHQSLNLRDSGLDVIVGCLDVERERVKADGLTPVSIEEASREGDIIPILIPDTIQPQVYKESIEPNLVEGKALLFAHGFNIHFGQIIPPPFVDVIMVAPKGPGPLVREMYEKGMGVPSLVAVHQDRSGNALPLALAYAKGIGATRAGVIETTFAEETETDLFGEQVVLCGGVTELIKAGFETLVEAGYQPEIAYFEVLHELKLIVDLIYSEGIDGMRSRVSDTAKYGDLTRGRRIINEDTRKEMKKILEEIRSGEFAREWILENMANRPVFRALRKRDAEHQIEEVGRKLRSMMPWLKR